MSYRAIFDQAIGEAPPSGVDVEAVVRRQRRAARVGPALATLAAVAVVATGGGVALQLTGEDTPVQVPGDELAGFPEYLDGTRVIAAAEGSMAEPLSLTFTPGTVELVLFSRCESDQAGDGSVMLEAVLSSGAGTPTTVDMFCVVGAPGGMAGGGLAPQEGAGWDPLWDGLAAGEAATIDISVVGAEPMAGGEPLAIRDGTLAVAVGEPVPWEEYVFPPRPPVLPPLPEPVTESVEVRADPADPNRRVETTMTWQDEYGCGGEVGHPFSLISQTPGSLTVFVNGVEMGERTWWDYEQQEVGFLTDAACGEVADGETVTLAVEPEHMTGDWSVLLFH